MTSISGRGGRLADLRSKGVREKPRRFLSDALLSVAG